MKFNLYQSNFKKNDIFLINALNYSFMKSTNNFKYINCKIYKLYLKWKIYKIKIAYNNKLNYSLHNSLNLL
jgi:hypothetical protein